MSKPDYKVVYTHKIPYITFAGRRQSTVRWADKAATFTCEQISTSFGTLIVEEPDTPNANKIQWLVITVLDGERVSAAAVRVGHFGGIEGWELHHVYVVEETASSG
jgi:hypothetical protein